MQRIRVLNALGVWLEFIAVQDPVRVKAAVALDAPSKRAFTCAPGLARFGISPAQSPSPRSVGSIVITVN